MLEPLSSGPPPLVLARAEDSFIEHHKYMYGGEILISTSIRVPKAPAVLEKIPSLEQLRKVSACDFLEGDMS